MSSAARAFVHVGCHREWLCWWGRLVEWIDAQWRELRGEESHITRSLHIRKAPLVVYFCRMDRKETHLGDQLCLKISMKFKWNDMQNFRENNLFWIIKYRFSWFWNFPLHFCSGKLCLFIGQKHSAFQKNIVSVSLVIVFALKELKTNCSKNCTQSSIITSSEGTPQSE